MDPSQEVSLTDGEFARFRKFICDAAGIQLSDAKKALVASRLAKRVRARAVRSYTDYYELITSGRDPAELQTAVDLLTTNETYFFREPKHFDFLRNLAQAWRAAPASPRRPMKVWSAACSSGEEPYSIAMLLADVLGANGFEVFASDLSTRMLDKARSGHYPMDRASHVSHDFLRRFCLKGIEEQAGTLLVEDALRARVSFAQINLMHPLPDAGPFDVVFLRNVLIYFDGDTKREVVCQVLGALRPGGHLLIGHSESLHGIVDAVEPVAPTIYRKPAAGGAKQAGRHDG